MHTRTYLSICIYRYILLYTHLYILYLYFYVRWHYNNRYSICNTRTQRTFARKNCEHFVENLKHFTFIVISMIIIYISFKTTILTVRGKLYYRFSSEDGNATWRENEPTATSIRNETRKSTVCDVS